MDDSSDVERNLIAPRPCYILFSYISSYTLVDKKKTDIRSGLYYRSLVSYRFLLTLHAVRHFLVVILKSSVIFGCQ